MVKIIYIGDVNPCNVRVRSGRIKGWKKGEIKEVGEEDAKSLLVQSYFVVAEGEIVMEEKEKIPTLEEVSAEEEIVEPEEVEEPIELPREEFFDYETALKDELLDYTANHGIEADYSNTVKELKEMIKEYLEE